MKRPLCFSQTSSPRSQRGIATVLIVVLIGVALTATAMGIMHSMRSSQEKHVAVHAATNAQVGAWAGVEAFRLYLDSQGVAGLANGGTYPISLDGYGTMTAKDIKITDTATGHRVGATIVNVQDAAHSSAAVGVMYEITSTAGEYQLSGPLNFNDDLMLTSRLVLDNPMSLNVKGDVTINNANITNLLGINTTGSVTVSSNNAINLGTIHANGDVKLSGTDAFAPEIKTQGEVKLEGSARAPLISANRKVVHNANSNTTSMRSRSDIEIGNSSGNHEYVNSGGKATIESAYSRTITTLSSVGRINNKSAAATLTNVQGEENLDCLSAWNSFTNIGINGTLGENCTHLREPPDGQTVAESAGISVPVMPPVTPFRMPTLAVDVYPFRGEANYWVFYEDGKIKVRVSNVNGLADDVYYVGYSGDVSVNDIRYRAHKTICSTLDANGKCTSDTRKYMCLGESPNEGCLMYTPKSFTVADNAEASITYHALPAGAHSSKGTFLVAGAGIAPGIWWFDGNLVFSNGYNNGTILVTGNIATSNHYRGAAVNYGAEPVVYSHTIRDVTQRTTPYQEICEIIGTGLNNEEMRHQLADYRTHFINQFPTNLCNKEDGIYIPHTLGNIALAAGGIRPANDEILGGDGDGETYSGGDISIKSNSNVFGIALAGGYLSLRNNVAIMGYISASVQGPQRGPNAVKNVADGDIKIYTDSETEWYSPSTVPWMGQDPCQIGCGTSLPGGGAKLLWSRYL